MLRLVPGVALSFFVAFWLADWLPMKRLTVFCCTVEYLVRP